MMTETQMPSGESTTPRKYLFDLTFDNGQNKKTAEREKPKPTFTQEQLDLEKQASFEQGMQAGQQSMMEDQQQYMNALLTKIDQNLSHVVSQGLTQWQDLLSQIQSIALVIMRKMMPNYVEQYGLGEVESIVGKVIAEVSREPRLVFRINEQMFDTISEKINAIAAQQAYAGKIVILGDPLIDVSDCRIEWADGGIERNVQLLWQSIERVISESQTSDAMPSAPSDDSAQSTPEQTQQPTTDSGEQP